MIPLTRANEILQLSAKMFQHLNDLELKSIEMTVDQCRRFAFITLRTWVNNRESWTRHLLEYLRPRIAKWLETTPADHDDQQIAAAFILAFVDQQMSRVCQKPGAVERATLIIRFQNIPKRRFERVPGKSMQVPSTQAQEQMAKGGLN